METAIESNKNIVGILPYACNRKPYSCSRKANIRISSLS